MKYDTAVDNAFIEKSTVQDIQGGKKKNRCFINYALKVTTLIISQIFIFCT